MLFVFVTSVLFPLQARAVTPVILDRAPSVELSGYMERYDDLSGKQSFSDILNPNNPPGFEHLDGYLNDGYSHKAVWLRFTVNRTSRFSADSWLRLDSPYLDHVTAYVQTGGDPYQISSYRTFRLGDHTPVAERPVLAPDFLLPLSLPLETPITIYVRVQSISSLTFSATVHTLEDIVYYTAINILVQSGYLTIAIVIALLNLIFFMRIGDRLFLYFSLYAFAVFINYLSISGILSLILPDSAHLLADYLADLGKGGGILLVSIFLKRLFETELTLFIRRYLEFMALVGMLIVLADPLGFYIEIAPASSLSVLFLFFVVTWLSIKAVNNKKPGGILFFMAFGISNLGYFLHFIKLLGWVPIEWWNINNIQLSSLLNMVLMTIALTERLHAMEQRAIIVLRESELKAVELETERVAAERTQRFLTMMSHEYRTPLAIISSSIDIMQLQNGELNAENMAELGAMKRAVHRLVEVMEVSLEKSHLSDTQERESIKRIVVKPFVASNFADIRALWPKRIFTCVTSLASHEIYAEPHSLTIALFNLIDNAQKYSPPDSPIAVDCRGEGNEVIISVRNQVIGIMPDTIEELFEKYRRGSNSNNTNGSGIGLWLVREIIHRHHGRVTLESRGGYVIATVHLPLADPVQKA